MGASDEAWATMIHNGDRALAAIGAHLVGEGSRNAPLKLGHLRSVGRYELHHSGTIRWVEVTFSLPYAAVQHEREDFEHPRGGKAHYLSDPLKANAMRYEEIMSKAVLTPHRLP